ncbi:MAG: CvpA family protein [Candidatus Marinimicrobia bacterium]|jgi:membrane protein required for colicin V production|nr:CvpA family protein [Candidatus Neomarinimicrobiota bacterium]MBT5955992.1 CvpA family protein [Candidatus Neomarinimicrobiota bacterium]MBT6871015.1 CvpA family protein [Candidatus Neomarinimicrobiota bacterium]MBT7377923.1 CvpA family protein [Candidatus Neomarinimicrobiota bacterium]|tara:strand:+ start:8468 stop:9022 length:555 start_codon:yes stop_codon:yes gene_type:complete
MTFTPPDILILIILGFFTFSGFRNGFIKEAARFMGMIGGFFAAHNFHDDLMPFLEVHISNPNILTVASYLGVFCITLFVINTLAMVLQKFFEFILLGWLNRLLGTLLGLIKGVLVVSIIIFILEIAPTEIRDKLHQDSEMYKICNSVKNQVITLSKLTQEIDTFQEEIHESLKEENIKKVLGQE